MKNMRGTKTRSTIRVQVVREENDGENFLCKNEYTGLKIPVSRNESTRIEKKGHRSLAINSAEMRKSIRKYLKTRGVGGFFFNVLKCD